jgi:hypothetical protein
MSWPCQGGCGRQSADDPRPWLLITGERPLVFTAPPPRRRVPFAYLFCPDCEDSAYPLAEELHDMMGKRLKDNADHTIKEALRKLKCPVQPPSVVHP